MSTSYNPQIDGQMKAVNKCLEMYLCFFSSKKKHQWFQWFPLYEWWYNTTYHEATKMTPYEVVYGKKIPSITSYLPGTSKVQEVETLLQNRHWTLETLKDNLANAQNCMKHQVDQHRSK